MELGIRFRFLKRSLLGLCGTALFFAALPQMGVLADEKKKYPISYEKDSGSENSYMALEEAETAEYTVLSGDSLWNISEKLWGDGHYYSFLLDANPDISSNPNLIYPGMTLKTARTGYIERTEAKYGGIQMEKYSMDMPYGWTLGYMDSGKAWANFVMRGDGVSVACLVQDKEKDTVKTVRDWEKCVQEITAYADENYPAKVSDLSFEHYRMKDQGDGTGEIYLYSILWHVTPEYPNLICEVSMGMKLTDHIQAEFVGIGDYDIKDCIRYVTASFEEHFDEKNSKNFTVNDSNTSIAPITEWTLSGMFNPFPFVDEYFTSKLDKIMGKIDGTGKEEGTGKYKGLIGG